MDELDAEFYFQLGGPRRQPIFKSAEIRRAFGSEEAAYLGTGTYGETWKIAASDGPRAVKVMHFARYPLQRLRREIEGLRRGASPHVVRLLSTRTVDLRGEQRPVLEFEFVSGGDAETRIAGDDWPPAAQVRGFGTGVLRGLVALHSHETVHRDLKFGNIVLRSGRWIDPVILDLGLARTLDETTLTQYPLLLGTIPFMAPEQVRAEPARKGADLWALGVMMFILLARRHPFYGDRAQALSRIEAAALLSSGPPPIPKVGDASLAAVVTRLLQPQPYMRGTAVRALEELER